MNHLLNSSMPPRETVYTTDGNLKISRFVKPLPLKGATSRILAGIDARKGALFTSRYEFPGRYSRWDIGFLDPPLELRAFGESFVIEAHNARGMLLLDCLWNKLVDAPYLRVERSGNQLTGMITEAAEPLAEEERTLRPSIFTIMRAFKEMFGSEEDNHLGLYGTYGYDLVFQFDPMEWKHERDPKQADLVLYLPDDLIVVDHKTSCAYQVSYQFWTPIGNTYSLPREQVPGISVAPKGETLSPQPYQHGYYADLVQEAIEAFRVGDLFEVVPSQTIREPYTEPASKAFNRLMSINPSPYGFILNLGSEWLVGSSPEMFVRVEGRRVETCPISGTIKRGQSPLEDAEQIRRLLNSDKDEAELTMCTDVDRNDKSRICVPGSVRVIGRRQLEMYSHLIHTVDHIEGELRPEFDALDAFMTHMWAVTVTGAPKRAAIRWIEQHEDSPRRWYGGAIGFYQFNGDLNTGMTLRTVSIRDGCAEIRVGATLLYDSVPEEEEAETLTKAAALIQAIREESTSEEDKRRFEPRGTGKRVLIVDHEDSFVHTLGNYIRQTGAEVLTLRSAMARTALAAQSPFDYVVLSPGPGRPADFDLAETISLCLSKRIPIFGVCLGLQGIVEYFGGRLGLLPEPEHGKRSRVKLSGPSVLWTGLPDAFTVGRYHSLYAEIVTECLTVTAVTDDGVVMAVEHSELPIRAVQFHPESILSMEKDLGLILINNLFAT